MADILRLADLSGHDKKSLRNKIIFFSLSFNQRHAQTPPHRLHLQLSAISTFEDHVLMLVEIRRPLQQLGKPGPETGLKLSPAFGLIFCPMLGWRQKLNTRARSL